MGTIHVSYRLSIEAVKTLEAFAEKHGISLTEAVHTLLFIGHATTELCERGLDIGDY